VYREEEAVAELEDALLEPVPAPHHLQVVALHVRLLGGEVHAVHTEPVAEGVPGVAPLERLAVHCNDQQVLRQLRGALAVPEALQEQVQERTRSGPGLVDRSHQDSLVRRRGSPEQVREVLLGRVLLSIMLFGLIYINVPNTHVSVWYGCLR
jgi:hypothetical protein